MAPMALVKGCCRILFGLTIGVAIGLVLRSFQSDDGRLQSDVPCVRKFVDTRHPLEIVGMHENETVHNSQRNLLFVGVMTAKSFLRGRARAVYETWGKEVPGRIAFFSSEGSRSSVLPVVALPGVDDRYPPQKKSFMMLYYMYEHFIDRFEWFARTDDDVYINTMKLERLLRSVDSSKPQFIGQAGKGNSEEFGLLSLEFDENFCMGGPGVIMSRETLRRVAPHISTCLQNLYSTHEDVEIGRCVQKFAGIPCTWNYEMQSILRHNSSGRYAYTGSLKSKEIHNAITLHPVKMAPLMYRLHAYMKGLRAQELRQEALELHRDIATMKALLAEVGTSTANDPMMAQGPEHEGHHEVLGKRPNLKKHEPQHWDELQHWDFLARSIYSADTPNPKRKIDTSMKQGLDDVIGQVMDHINNFSRQRGRVIEFRELLYGYSRVNALYGHDLVLDLLLIYKKYRGKKMTVPVRRHLYIQRAFTDVFVRETTNGGWYDALPGSDMGENSPVLVDEDDEPDEADQIGRLRKHVRNLWNTGVERIAGLAKPRTDELPADEAANAVARIEDKKIVFVLSLAGRFQTFVRFLRNYREVCLDNDQNTDLLVVFFDDGRSDTQASYDEMDSLARFHPSAAINRITLDGAFSRGKALDTAVRSHFIQPSDIAFFVDVDITFMRESLDRIRFNTVAGRQVYMPIVFSQYAPKSAGGSASDDAMANATIEGQFSRPADLGEDEGYFRQFGYGIVSIYHSDIMHPSLNGFRTDIKGWGLEDVRFLEQIVKLNQMPKQLLLNMVDNSSSSSSPLPTNAGGSGGTQPSSSGDASTTEPLRLDVFRAADPSLVHVYHAIECDPQLDEAQYKMCVGTKGSTQGSYWHMENRVRSDERILKFLREQENNKGS